MSEAAFQAIEAQLAAALHRAREWERHVPADREPVHDSPVYAELERLSKTR